ncbi:DNA-binding transcriptional LysR family regulator [Saccharothrix ecbatanensis]|uniref:DNA-binding transcriptional LysR family regulator n=1 Tax=Saccharothrix ecbatanensis TaxID=1105145 RepID=A0A7W9HIZ0_9PSEU|nr:LysR family transcriptional regulator [Saccharothrix ecbatanensis]MBB5802866.1 DNA-binding transcriptional LysR family regulator [Saccharothrix ecbatanensis]
MNVELRHLRAFAAIGNEGTITAAAAVLRISQPALSRTLDQLESRLGTRLVERTTRSLALTEAGTRLLDHANRILNQVDDALAEVTAGPRALRVGFAWAALGRHTVPLLRGWREARPDAEVRVFRLDDPEAALRLGELDVAFVRTPLSGSGLASLDLYRERRVAAVPEDHPFALVPGVRLDDLADHPVALCATASSAGVSLWPAERRPHTFEVANTDEWLTAIATGDAVGVTTEATEHTHPHPGVRYVPITDAEPVTVRMVSPQVAAHPATRAFRDHARSLLGDA